jgi:hypothetical protein
VGLLAEIPAWLTSPSAGYPQAWVGAVCNCGQQSICLLFHPRQIESPLPQCYPDAPRRAAGETPKRQPAIGPEKDQQAWPLIVMRRAAALEITARRPPALGQHNRRNHFRVVGHLRNFRFIKVDENPIPK